jgi:hypothetical protein
LRLATSSVRCSARVSSSTARRETTMLPRARSILRIWNGCGVPISGPTSRTGRISTWLPGRNATAPPRSTVKPPLTRPKIVPVTRCLASNAFSRLVQASSRRAFSRDSLERFAVLVFRRDRGDDRGRAGDVFLQQARIGEARKIQAARRFSAAIGSAGRHPPRSRQAPSRGKACRYRGGRDRNARRCGAPKCPCLTPPARRSR